MWRTLLLALAFAACRFGFDDPPRESRDAGGDASTLDAATSDAAIDAASDAAIDARPVACNDTFCDGNAGETCNACPSDCMTTMRVCGNGICTPDEDAASCFTDCGPAMWPPAWDTFATGMIQRINEHRAMGTDCPSSMQAAVPALSPHVELIRISRNHAWDQSHHDYIGPTDGTRCNGQTIFDVMREQQFNTGIGAATQTGTTGTAADVVDDFMGVQVLCGLIMNPSFTRVGAGFADDVGVAISCATFAD